MKTASVMKELSKPRLWYFILAGLFLLPFLLATVYFDLQWRLQNFIRKTLWRWILETIKKQVPKKHFSKTMNWSCSSNPEKKKKKSKKAITEIHWLVLIYKFKCSQTWEIWPSPLNLSLSNNFVHLVSNSSVKLG